MRVLFVGHRGSGKSTTAFLVAEALGIPFVDLDEVIERSEGKSCATLVAEDEPRFRELEVKHLAEVFADDNVIVGAGAGLVAIPAEPVVVWLSRDGWEDSARDERERLRPDMEWEEELEWMATTREPRWMSSAHLHIRIPRGRTPARATQMVATMLMWLAAPKSETAAKTWVVPSTPGDLDRADRDARRFGLAGVEVRSDTIVPFRPTEAPVLASIRTNDGDWIQAAGETAVAFDIDITQLDAFDQAGGFSLTPRPLILSTHPAAVDPEDVTSLTVAARRIQVEHPEWAAELSLKYAPAVESFGAVGMGRALTAPLRRANVPVTYLPQGERWAWLRPVLAAENVTNYVASRLRPARVGVDEDAHTAWDLQDWLPHLVAPAPTTWDALIGDPVDESQGDLWHRRAALQSSEPTGYVKAQVSDGEFDAALSLLRELGFRGVSVTSPLKKRVRFICPDDSSYGPLLTGDDIWKAAKNEVPLRTGNTLRRSKTAKTGWVATDTDELGMEASLQWFEEREIGPATIALYGSGGVSEALIRAVDRSDWFIVSHTRARDGWGDDKPPFVTLVVNAAGASGGALHDPPKSRGWLDLHYNDVVADVAGVLHLTGDVFFDAQAEAQRTFWRGE